MQDQIQRKSTLTGCPPIVEIAKNRSPNSWAFGQWTLFVNAGA
jgi:hypothetical protein